MHQPAKHINKRLGKYNVTIRGNKLPQGHISRTHAAPLQWLLCAGNDSAVRPESLHLRNADLHYTLYCLRCSLGEEKNMLEFSMT